MMSTRRQTSPARDLLLALLADGPRPTTEIKAAATARGIPWRNIARARARLNVTAELRGFGPGARWWCELPPGTNTSQPRYIHQQYHCANCGSTNTYPIPA